MKGSLLRFSIKFLKLGVNFLSGIIKVTENFFFTNIRGKAYKQHFYERFKANLMKICCKINKLKVMENRCNFVSHGMVSD